MARSSADYWSNRFSNSSDSNGDENNVLGTTSDRSRGCDRESSKALKEILSLLDDLNNSDLRLLEEILDRLICERKC